MNEDFKKNLEERCNKILLEEKNSINIDLNLDFINLKLEKIEDNDEKYTDYVSIIDSIQAVQCYLQETHNLYNEILLTLLESTFIFNPLLCTALYSNKSGGRIININQTNSGLDKYYIIHEIGRAHV